MRPHPSLHRTSMMENQREIRVTTRRDKSNQLKWKSPQHQGRIQGWDGAVLGGAGRGGAGCRRVGCERVGYGRVG